MASMNKVILMGNLTRDPELKHISSGRAVADMRLAMSEKYKNKDGEIVESTCFIDIVVWGRQAETCNEFLHKGSPAIVEGKLQYESWENDEGQRRSRIRVVASRVQFVGGRRSSGEQQNAENKEEMEDEMAGMPF